MEKSNIHFIGKILIANEIDTNSIFHKACILVCAHDSSGAMGLILNKPEHNIVLSDLLIQMEIPTTDIGHNPHIYTGGPIDSSHGFILHEAQYHEKSTAPINDDYALTATVGILSHIVENQGPTDYKICLGYAGWDAGQLEQEIKSDTWICVDATKELVFHTPCDTLWYIALSQNGIPPHALNAQIGHA